jgi:hypothetical protein
MTHTPVGVEMSQKIEKLQARVVMAHPAQMAQRKRPSLVIIAPATMEAGTSVRLIGSMEIPVCNGEFSRTDKK